MASLIETKNLTMAAKECGYSYKYAWKKLKDIERKIGRSIVIAKKGGYGGGGTVEITSWGKIFSKSLLQCMNESKFLWSQ